MSALSPQFVLRTFRYSEDIRKMATYWSDFGDYAEGFSCNKVITPAVFGGNKPILGDYAEPALVPPDGSSVIQTVYKFGEIIRREVVQLVVCGVS
jgi:hypothetical protein